MTRGRSNILVDLVIVAAPFLGIAALSWVLLLAPLAEERRAIEQSLSIAEKEAAALGVRLEAQNTQDGRLLPDAANFWASETKQDRLSQFQRSVLGLAEAHQASPHRYTVSERDNWIALKMESQADIADLAAFMIEIERHEPVLVVDQIAIRTASARDQAPGRTIVEFSATIGGPAWSN